MTSKNVLAHARDELLGGGRYQEKTAGPFHYVLSRVRPASGEVELVSVPFFPHGLTTDPADRQRIFAFEKIGPGAGVIDLKTMTWQQAITPGPGRIFYGHGACSPDGEWLYSTEIDAQGQGAIGIREARSLRYVGDLPAYGANPHDCTLLDDGNVMAVTNGGGVQGSGDAPCLCYIEIPSGKLIERADMPDDRFNTGHFFPLPHRQAVVVSAPRLGLDAQHLGAISRAMPGQPLSVFSAPGSVVNRLQGEALSVLALPEHDLLVVTHPTPGLVTFWRLGSGDFLQWIELPLARGVAADVHQQSLWIGYGASASLLRVSLDSLSPIDGSVMERTFLAGSHLFNHSLMP